MNHLALVGPKASGKSALALEVARAVGGIEIVVVDSMQVYRGMDIGTAKPSLADQAEVPHHLIDLAQPSEDFTVSHFQAVFRDVMQGIESRGTRALLVGGTGLYLRAVVDDLTVPGTYDEVRAELEDDADTVSMHARLSQLDPVAAGRMEPTNRRRVVRALEVTLGSGRPFSSFGPGLQQHPASRFRMAGVWLPRPVLNARIEHRWTAMREVGLLDEVRRLRRDGHLSRTARQALGYRELLAHLEDGQPLEDADAEAIRRTRAFARRQRGWFRRDPRIRWFGAPANPVSVLPALLGDWTECLS